MLQIKMQISVPSASNSCESYCGSVHLDLHEKMDGHMATVRLPGSSRKPKKDKVPADDQSQAETTPKSPLLTSLDYAYLACGKA